MAMAEIPHQQRFDMIGALVPPVHQQQCEGLTDEPQQPAKPRQLSSLRELSVQRYAQAAASSAPTTGQQLDLTVDRTLREPDLAQLDSALNTSKLAVAASVRTRGGHAGPETSASLYRFCRISRYRQFRQRCHPQQLLLDVETRPYKVSALTGGSEWRAVDPDTNRTVHGRVTLLLPKPRPSDVLGAVASRPEPVMGIGLPKDDPRVYRVVALHDFLELGERPDSKHLSLRLWWKMGGTEWKAPQNVDRPKEHTEKVILDVFRKLNRNPRQQDIEYSACAWLESYGLAVRNNDSGNEAAAVATEGEEGPPEGAPPSTGLHGRSAAVGLAEPRQVEDGVTGSPRL